MTVTRLAKQQILLEKKELLKWKKWDRNSRIYIESHEEIDMKAILAEYQTLDGKLYEWFYNKVGKIYSKELQEFIETQSELAQLG